MERVLLIGGTGFLGQWMVRRAPASVPRDAIFTAGRRPMPDAPKGTHLAVDVTAQDVVPNLFAWANPSIVVHVAGKRKGSEDELLAIHCFVTAKVLRVAAGMRARVVVVGSSAELGASDGRRTPLDEEAPVAPVTTYGHTKAAQEALARAFAWKDPVVYARLFNVIGPGLAEGLVPADLANQVVEAETSRGRVVVGRTDAVRDFLDVRDAADALWKLALSDEKGLFHVGSGKGTRIGDLAAMFLAEAKGPCSLVEEETPRTPADVDWQVADISKIRARVGWAPRIPLAQSVRDMLAALRG